MSLIETVLSRSGLASMLSGLLEGMGIPWPGAVVLTAAGTEAPNPAAAVVLALCFGLVYTASSWLQYLMGRHFWRFIQGYVSSEKQERLYRLMQKHGELAVLWTRPLAVGNYVSLPAGVIRMHQGKFLLYTFVGIMPWCLLMTFAGSLIGAYLSTATHLLTLTAVGLALVGGLTAAHRAIRRRHAQRVSSFCD
ncbi:MAG: DedA family protein [Bacillota bacterium]